MGVIKRIQRSAIDASLSENEALGEIVIGIQQQEEAVDQALSGDEGGRQQPNNFSPRRTRARVPAIPLDTTPRRNNMNGSRRTRRYENNLVLLRESGRDDHDEEVSIEDLVDVGSARNFTRFFCEATMIGLWNTFVECQDEMRGTQPGISSNTKSGLVTKSTDPEHAFQRICRKLRNFLKKRHLALGIVDNLEEQVVEFFQTHPLNSTYQLGPLDAYRRSLLHAISQYNNLKSYSVGKKKTEKIVHVKNKETEFSPPSLRLVSYIETRLQSEQKY